MKKPKSKQESEPKKESKEPTCDVCGTVTYAMECSCGGCPHCCDCSDDNSGAPW